jgi:4-amino-4-deoxy-L-arabinose transferase-like glycosyltransferase
LHLQKLPIHIWDEARLANNAIEMNNNNNLIVTYFEGKPDLWNTKPPFLIWMQMLMIKIFGINEIAIRLPSALAALFTSLFLFYFLWKLTKEFWFGFIASIILATASGYVHHHGTRTGDYDSMLTLLSTISLFSFFYYIQSKNTKYLKLFFIFLTASVLTKGVQPLVLLPGLLFYLLFRFNSTKNLIVNKYTIFYSLVFIIITAGYYLMREHYNPGYINAVYMNELGGRYLSTIEGHHHPFNFYFDNLYNYRFSYWMFPLFIGVIIGLLHKNNQIKDIILFCSITSLSYLLLISIAKTKLEWYDLPAFPLLSVIAAASIHELFLIVQKKLFASERIKYNIIPFITLFFVFYIPYKEIINKVYFPKIYDFYYESIPELIRSISSKDHGNYHICWDNTNRAHLNFYIAQHKEKSYVLNYKDFRQLQPYDTVIASQGYEKYHIETNYKFSVLKEKLEAKMYRIEP